MTRLLLALILALCTLHLRAQVVINEICASNLNGVMDADGDREDWVELYNNGPATVNLAGWFLSDDPLKPQKWAVPAGVTINPGAYRVFYCSGKNKTAGLFIHTSFKITQTNGESVVLTRPDGTAADTYTFTTPNLADQTYGRSPNGSATWKIHTTPTPGASNSGTTYQSYAPAVVTSIPAGFYPGSIAVTLGTDPGFTIRYTTNGSEPTAASTVYVAPVNITATTVLKARAFSANPQIYTGFVTANTYFINVTHSVPVLSIAGDNIVALLNGSYSRPFGSLEYFENQVLVTEAYGEFNKHGNDSWAYPQRGIDWITRDQMGYEDELKHKFFKERKRGKFQRLILKAAANDNYPSSGGAHIRDSYVHTLALHGGMNVDVRTHRSAVMYVNGQYWGVYDIREKVDDADFTQYYYDQNDDDLDYIKTWGSTWAEYGTMTDWFTLKNFILGNSMVNPANYNYVKSQLDFLSLIDYVIINQHSVCKDWLNWNTSWWRGRNPAGQATRWRYSLWDMDATFGHYVNYTGIPNTGPTADPCDVEVLNDWSDPQNHIDIMVALMANPQFHDLYVNRYADLLNTALSCDYMNALLDSMTNEIAPEMARHCTRWGGTVGVWQQNVQKIHDFINTRCVDLDQSIPDCYDVSGPFNLQVKISPAASANQVTVNTITPAAYPFTGEYYGGVNINLTAQPAAGWQFDHWEVMGNTFGPNQLASAIVLAFKANGMVTAFFIPTGPCTEPTGITFNQPTAASSMTWTAQPSAASYLIQYRKQGDPDWNDVLVAGNTWNFDTLPGCADYQGQILAICPQGSSAFTPFTFSTPDHLPVFTLADAVICNTGSAVLDATTSGATYEWDDSSNGPTRSVSGAGNYWVSVSLKGCTAKDTASVTVIDASASLQPVLCPGETFLVGSTTFDAQNPSGQVTLPGLAAGGCDSIVNVSLQFLNVSEETLHKTSCNPADVGMDTLVLTNVLGCDSLVITATTLSPFSQTDLAAKSCNPAQVGVDTVVLVNQFGCDSLVITTTILSPFSETLLSAKSCNTALLGIDTVLLVNQLGCDSLVITTTTFDPSAIPVTALSAQNCDPAMVGVDTLVLNSAAGCDSLVVTTTILVPTSQVFLSTSSCNPALIGTDTLVLSNQFGCDSLVITATSFDPSMIPVTSLFANSCNPAMVGVDTLVLNSAAGCDSLVVTTTTFDPSGIPVTLLTAKNCDPAMVGVDTVVLSSAAGCDSLVVTTTTLAPTSQTQLAATTCDPAAAGTATAILSNQFGCDSTVVTTTTFDPALIPVTFLTAKNCDPAMVGVDTVVLSSAAGCDSLVVTATTLAPTSQTQLAATTCDPGAAGTATVVLSNQFGCDSTVTTVTTFDPALIPVTLLAAKNCDPAMVGVDTLVLNSAASCDSLVVTTTTLAPSSQTQLSATTCDPGAVGTATVVLSNQFGCDSTVVTAITFDPALIPVTLLAAKNCDPAMVGVDTVVLNSAAGCDSLVVTTTTLAPTSQTLLSATTCDPDAAGTATVILSNLFGCDSTVTTETTYTGLDFDALAQAAFCFGGRDGSVRVENVLTGWLPVELTLENRPTQTFTGIPLRWENLAAGTYTLTATNAAGCTATQTVEVGEGAPLHLDFGTTALKIHTGDSIWVEPAADFPIVQAVWSPALDVHCPDCPATFLSPQHTGIYTLTASDPGGCSVSATLTVQVEQGIRLFVPNAIRPGNGGQNASLTISAGPEVVRIRSFRIFDRWGNQVFEQKDLTPNSTGVWDGTYQGELLNPGVLIWVCTVETQDGQVETKSGDITVLR